MESLSNLIEVREKTLVLKGFDPISADGFIQLPTAILRKQGLTMGAKLVYASLLSYAWQKNSCFPGQETLSEDLGISRRSVVTFLQELEQIGYIEKIRRGLGKTNVYVLHAQIKKHKA